MDSKSLEKRLAEINEMRKEAEKDPEFQALAKEHESSIMSEVEKTEALSREHGKCSSRKRKSKNAKSISTLAGSGIDNAIID
ncbi:hypothetical protein ACQ895_01475 [Vibrio parahaemolyticus]|uniref:hypothetical protein n=1 Tax=Vibrio parahaemolyticus TaxID=670 RepID=UPI001B825364|nr:hypothetical protein [Vibrio parahaemolyticus]